MWIDTLFSDKLITFVLGIVVVFKFSGGVELEIKELVTVGSSMADAVCVRGVLVSQEKVIGAQLHASYMICYYLYKNAWISPGSHYFQS